jgi:hypothetical protein
MSRRVDEHGLEMSVRAATEQPTWVGLGAGRVGRRGEFMWPSRGDCRRSCGCVCVMVDGGRTWASSASIE